MHSPIRFRPRALYRDQQFQSPPVASASRIPAFSYCYLNHHPPKKAPKKQRTTLLYSNHSNHSTTGNPLPLPPAQNCRQTDQNVPRKPQKLPSCPPKYSQCRHTLPITELISPQTQSTTTLAQHAEPNLRRFQSFQFHQSPKIHHSSITRIGTHCEHSIINQPLTPQAGRYPEWPAESLAVATAELLSWL